MPEEPARTRSAERFDVALDVLDELLPGRAFLDPLFEKKLDLLKSRIEWVTEQIAAFANSECEKATNRDVAPQWRALLETVSHMQRELENVLKNGRKLEEVHSQDEGWNEQIGDKLAKLLASVSYVDMSLLVTQTQLLSIFAGADGLDSQNVAVSGRQFILLVKMLSEVQEASKESFPAHPFSKEVLTDAGQVGLETVAECLLEGAKHLVVGAGPAIDALKHWRHERVSADEAIRRVRAFIILHRIMEWWETGAIKRFSINRAPECETRWKSMQATMSKQVEEYAEFIDVAKQVLSRASELSS